MPKPLRSEDPTPKSVQFSHFGVLDDGQQSKGAFATSVLTNILVALLVIVVGSVVKHKIDGPKVMSTLVAPIPEQPKPPPPPPPKIVAPKPIPEAPKPIEPPKIQPPIVEKAPEIKPMQPIPVPKPVLAPPAPKKVEAPPAPKVVSLAAKAASIPNNDTHPTAVALGRTDSPVKNGLTGPAVSDVRLGQGMPGMPAGNTGNGPAAKSVNMGSGAPNGSNLNGKANAPVAVAGLGTGCPGCTGKGPAQGPVAVKIGGQLASTPAARTPTIAAVMAKQPVVTFIPKPVYSAEAKTLHLEGDAQVRVKFLANGSMEVQGLAHGLGHGLDQAALDVAQGIRFKPATDASGNPVDFPTTVTVHFVIN